MRKHCLISKLALVALLVTPACFEGGADDGGGEPGDQLGTTEFALASDPCPPGTPAVLAPPAEWHLALALDAAGVQKYECRATAGGPAWTFVAPDAKLYATECHYVVGTHYAGPTWKYGDGSTVVGTLKEGVTVNVAAIPWLLLEVTSHGGSPGKLDRMGMIQRLATHGGLPPADGCDAWNLGATAAVFYTATYLFYRERPGNPHNRRCGAPN